MGMPEPIEPLRFPYCSYCVAHLRATQGADTAKLVAVNIGVWGVAIPMFANAPVGYLLLAPTVAAAFYAHAQIQRNRTVRLKENCTHPVVACRVAWYRRSTYQFSFASEEYANLFREANRAQLVQEP